MSTEIIEQKTPKMLDFELAQREAKGLAASELVPKAYQGNVANCLLAFNVAMRIGIDPFTVMQNIDIIHGKPGWRSQFLIATFNASGRYSAIKYRFDGEKDDYGCTAYTTELSTGDRIEGPKVTLKMVKAEGWMEKNGSKWKTMPDLMFRYRAAAFLVRTTAPEISMGLQTTEENGDVFDVQPTRVVTAKAKLAAICAPPEPPALEWDEAAFAAELKAAATLEAVNAVEAKWEPVAGEMAGAVAGLCEDKRQAMKGGA